MVVRVRFGRGTTVARRQRKNSRLARLAASLLTIGSIGCASLGAWRLGQDLDWAGDFVFTQGLLSHWMVWFAAAAGIQYAAWRLARYALPAASLSPEIEAQAERDSKPGSTPAHV